MSLLLCETRFENVKILRSIRQLFIVELTQKGSGGALKTVARPSFCSLFRGEFYRRTQQTATAKRTAIPSTLPITPFPKDSATVCSRDRDRVTFAVNGTRTHTRRTSSKGRVYVCEYNIINTILFRRTRSRSAFGSIREYRKC